MAKDNDSNRSGKPQGGDKPQQPKKQGGGSRLEFKWGKKVKGEDGWVVGYGIYDGSGKPQVGRADLIEGDTFLETIDVVPGCEPKVFPFKEKTREIDVSVKSVTIEGKAEFLDVNVPRPPLSLEGVGGEKGEHWDIVAVRADDSDAATCHYVNLTVYHYQPGKRETGVPALVDAIDGVHLTKAGKDTPAVYVPPEGLIMELPFTRGDRSATFSCRWVWDSKEQVYSSGSGWGPKVYNYDVGCNPNMHTKSVALPGQPWSKVTPKPKPVSGKGFWGNLWAARNSKQGG